VVLQVLVERALYTAQALCSRGFSCSWCEHSACCEHHLIGRRGFGSLHPWPSAPGRCAPSSRTVPSAGDSSGRPGPSDGLQGRHSQETLASYQQGLLPSESHITKQFSAFAPPVRISSVILLLPSRLPFSEWSAALRLAAESANHHSAHGSARTQNLSLVPWCPAYQLLDREVNSWR